MDTKDLTVKEKVLRMMERLPDDVSYDRVLYHVEVMKMIEERLEEAEHSEGMEHEEFMRQLEKECRESESFGARAPRKTSGKSAGTSPETPRGRRSRS